MSIGRNCTGRRDADAGGGVATGPGLSGGHLGIVRPPGTGRRRAQSHTRSDNQGDVLVGRSHPRPCQGDSATSNTQEGHAWLHSDVRGKKQAFYVITLKVINETIQVEKELKPVTRVSICLS